MDETAQRVHTFFESYRVAFERQDAPAIAEHFAYPSHLTSDAREIDLMAVAAKPDWIGQVERLLAMYRAIGVGSAHVLELASTELSPRLVQAVVHWALHDVSGGRLYDFQAMYTLAMIDDALRITAIAHNEIPRYRECLARLKSQGLLGDASSERPDRAD
jgi:hypothetical protein